MLNSKRNFHVHHWLARMEAAEVGMSAGRMVSTLMYYSLIRFNLGFGSNTRHVLTT